MWSKTLGAATALDSPAAVAVNAAGEIFVGGSTAGVFPGQSNDGYNKSAFVAALNSSGDVQWVSQFGASQQYSGYVSDLAVDATGIYIAGFTDVALAGQFKSGRVDGFVAKYNYAGNRVWTRQFGDAINVDSWTSVDGLSTAVDGGIYLAGTTNGSISGPPANANSVNDGFLRRLDTNGTEVWTNQFDLGGGAATTSFQDMTADSSGKVLVVGYAEGVLPGETTAGGLDAFVRQYDSQGNILWTKQFGTGENDMVTAVATDPDGYVYLSAKSWDVLRCSFRPGNPEETHVRRH